jgi:hypothetical protein
MPGFTSRSLYECGALRVWYMNKHASLNRAYRIIWSYAKQCLVVVSELAKSHGKPSGERPINLVPSSESLLPYYITHPPPLVGFKLQQSRYPVCLMGGLSIMTAAVSLSVPTEVYAGGDCATGGYTGGYAGCSSYNPITSLTNSGGSIVAVSSGTVTTPGSIISGSGYGIFNYQSTFNTLTNSGTISGSQNAGLLNSGGLFSVVGNTGGLLTGRNEAIYNNADGVIGTLSNSSGTIAGFYNGIINGSTGGSITGTIGVLSNTGTITGSVAGINNERGGVIGGANISTAVTNSGSISSLFNSGTIAGTITGIKNSGGVIGGATVAVGINNSGSIAAMSNSGTIYGSISGINNSGAIGKASILTAITNSGSITSLINNGVITGAQFGLFNNGGSVGTITNAGNIMGGHSGIIMIGGSIAGIANTGSIIGVLGGSAGINVRSGSIGTLTNGGTIASTDEVGLWIHSTISSISVVQNDRVIRGGYSGIQNDGFIGTITNTGTIIGSIYAMSSAGSIGVVENSGLIQGRYGIGNGFGFGASTLASLINSGTIIGANQAIGGTGNIGSITNSGVIDGNINLNANLTILGQADLYGTLRGGQISLGGNNLIFGSGNQSVNDVIGYVNTIEKVGTGTLNLTANNTFTSEVTISSGTIALTGIGAIAGSSVTDNGTFDISGTSAGASIASLSGGGTLALGNQTLALTQANGNFSGAITGSGVLDIVSGYETLSGVNNFGTLANAGHLSLTGTGSSLSNYDVLINSPSSYGVLSVSSITGTMAFGIDSHSTLAAGTLTDVLMGFSSLANVTGAMGTQDGLTYVLVEEGNTSNWDLVVSTASTAPYGTINYGSIGTLSNSGTISGTAVGVNNTGTIAGTLSNTGFISAGQTGILNSGTIESLANSGTITGTDYAIKSTSGHLGDITNSGVISGNISVTGQNLTISGASGSGQGTLTGGEITLDPTATLTFGGGNILLAENIDPLSVVNNANLTLNTAQTIYGGFHPDECG